ncbi:MAG: GDP-mannose 4,6-dehydratase [Crocinitomicaceae bacterium]|nr:GDP-mannose 4,6-dehydratase [Crocinitomicaceae bacterium]
MRVLITGGAGFIGSAVIKHLHEKHEIFVIDNLSFGTRGFIDQIEDDHFFENDIRDRDLMFDLINRIQPETVVHLAAIHFIPYCNEHPFMSSDINITGTMNILDACKAAGSVKKALFASTAAVYPIYDEAVTENHATGPLDVYGLSKLTGERLCNEFNLSSNIPVIICRFFNAFGPNETNPHLIPEIQDQVNSGKRTIQLGNLDPKRDFIHTYDMARAMELLLEAEIQGVETFNLGRGIEYSVREIVESFERQLGEKITIEVDPKRVRKTDRMHLLADVNKLKSFTGWNPEWSIDDGVKTLIEK